MAISSNGVRTNKELLPPGDIGDQDELRNNKALFRLLMKSTTEMGNTATKSPKTTLFGMTTSPCLGDNGLIFQDALIIAFYINL